MHPKSTAAEIQEFLSTVAMADRDDSLAKLKELRADIADVNVVNSIGKSALHCARHANVAHWLIDEGARLDAQDANGMTPLHNAAANSRPGLMYVLLDCGASTEIKSKGGNTALAYTCQYDWEIPKLILIAFGADTKNAPAKFRRLSPLRAAALANLPMQFTRLLGAGAPKKGPNSLQSLLEYAQGEFGRESICAILQAHMAKQAMAAIASRPRAAATPSRTRRT